MDLFDFENKEKNEVFLLDEEQNLAATSKEHKIIVKAGAGTGKTRTLIGRIIHLINDRKIDASHIMAVTFTNKAANEIKERTSTSIGTENAKKIIVGTFHAISARILRRHHHLVDLTKKFSIIDEDDVTRLIKDAILSCKILPQDISEEEREKLASEKSQDYARKIQTWKSWGLSTEDIEDESREKRSIEEEKAALVYLSYQNELRRRDMMDFGDLVLNTVSIFEKYPEICEEESFKIRHLLVDEAQDANPIQVRWVKLITSVHQEMTIIGDEDQSIFGFQAGYPNAITDMTKGNAKIYHLTKNRRCTKQILKPAVKLVNWNRRPTEKILESDKTGCDVETNLCGNDLEEATQLASKLKKLSEDGTSLNDCAILIRSSWVTPPIEEALMKQNLPYQLVGSKSISEREEVKDILSYVKLAINAKDDLAFRRICNKPARKLGVSTEDVIVKIATSENMNIFEACQILYEKKKANAPEEWKNNLRNLTTILINLDHMGQSFDIPPHVIVSYIISEEGVGYEKHLKALKDKKSAKKKISNMNSLLRISREETDTIEFVERVMLSSDDEATKVEKGHVRISTMHSSKGLEWEHVFLPSFDAAVIPSPRSGTHVSTGTAGDKWNGPKGGGIEEERRLAHVAMTRAKTGLYISSSLTRQGKKTYPSAFLPESGLDEILSIDAFNQIKGKAKGTSKFEFEGRKGFSKKNGKW